MGLFQHYLLLNKPYEDENKKMEQKYVSFLPGSSATPQSENKSEIGTKGKCIGQSLNPSCL